MLVIISQDYDKDEDECDGRAGFYMAGDSLSSDNNAVKLIDDTHLAASEMRLQFIRNA